MEQKRDACVELKATDGTIRFVRAGQPYRLQPGEVVVGANYHCDGIPSAGRIVSPAPQLRDELNEAIGVGMGDWIKTMVKPLAKLAGREKCTACEARRLATNAYAQLKGKHGQLKALSMMKELWELSFKAEPDEVLVKLKDYLGY